MSFKTKLFTGIVGCSLVILILLLKTSYPEFVNFIIESVGKRFPEKFVTNYFPSKSFLIAKVIGALSIILFTILFYLRYNALKCCAVILWRSIQRGTSSILRCIKQDFSNIGKWKYVLLLPALLILCLQVSEALSRPFQYDEAWSYNYHIGNNFFSSFLLPNNHTFYTVVAYFFNFLPFSHEFSVRLPLLLAGLASFCLLYYFLRQFFEVFSAWTGAVFFYSSSAVTFYTLYARGYMFVILFAVIFLIVSYKWIQYGLNNRYAFLWIFVSFISGIYSVPTSAYFFIPSFLTILYFIWQIDKTKFSIFFWGLFISLVLLTFLFLPALLSAHLKNLSAQGKISAPISFSFIVDYLYYNERYHFGTQNLNGCLYLFIIIGFLFLAHRFKQSKKYLILLSVVGLLTPILFLVVQRVMLAERLLIHLVIYFSIFIALLFSIISAPFKGKLTISKKMYATIIGTFLIVFLNLRMARSHHSYIWSIDNDTSLKKAAKAMQKADIDSVFISFAYSKPAIEYYYKIKRKKITIQMPSAASIDHDAYDPKKNYESILVKPSKPISIQPGKYDTIFQDEHFVVYKRKPVNVKIQ